MATTVVCWNIAMRHKAWRRLAEMDADVALLQEAGKPPADVAERVEIGPREHWDSHVWNSESWKGRWPYLYDRWAMVVKLSDRVDVEWFKQVSPISVPAEDEIAVSGIGTVAAARVRPRDGSKPFVAVSMYARWLRPHETTNSKWTVGMPDGSAHRILSDLSAFIGDFDPKSHRILAAGDLNMTYNPAAADPLAESARERTVFDRMTALGLEFLGPSYPNGRRAEPTPEWLPADTRNVPTYHTVARKPADALSQFDYVFASRGFHNEVTARALNTVEEWGPSDHCRLLIEVAG